MKDGFIKVAAGVPEIRVADVKANTESIKNIILSAENKGVNLLVFPELCVTGCTCGDLFLSDMLQSAALDALLEITSFTKDKYPVAVIGLPLKIGGKLFSVAAVIQGGEILGIIPKITETAPFGTGSLADGLTVTLNGKEIPVGNDLIFCHNELCEYTFSAEISEDLFAFNQPSGDLALGGAHIIVNPAAFPETVSSDENLRLQIKATSKRLLSGYILACADKGESTGDNVYSGYSIICEKGEVLAENPPFGDKNLIISEIDVKVLASEKVKSKHGSALGGFLQIPFNQKLKETEITRKIAKNPFVKKGESELNERLEKILKIQSYGLKKRLEHTYAKSAVIGISGGLDSTLALLVCVRAMKLCKRPLTDITAVTMPCFGTTKRTRSNSEKLCVTLGVNFQEVNITKAVKQHFEDIGQSDTTFDVTYENAQARERTQVLMDIANKQGGLVIGTGDLSELALGWATYNGDHMSMYGVNGGITKTLIRHIVRYEAENYDGVVKNILLDILDTPVSPELLPADNKGEIAQKTEDLVGPYELHDFFLYYTVRHGLNPSKIFRLATLVFYEYDKKTIHHWLTVFTRRFFNQQFKRSCLPDGPAVGSVSLSPRGAWNMPTDAISTLWLNELENIGL